MALLGFLKSREEEAGEPVLRDRPTILAYLEELIRLRTQVQVWFKKGDLAPTSGKIDLLQEDAGTMTMTLQRSIPGDLLPPAPMEMIFMIDSMRFLTQIKFKAREAYMKAMFQIPEVVRHAERRCKLRSRFGLREKATVTVLEGIFDGTGASGHLVNLSMEGLCMRIDRAISIREDRKLGLSTSLFVEGATLAIVRIQHLPNTPTIECSAAVAHISSTPNGIFMGLRLGCLGDAEISTMEQIMTRRLPSFGRGFPVKRRWAELHIDPCEAEADERALETELDPEEEDEVSTDGDEETLDTETSALQDPHQRLLTIKKRGKRILVVAKDDLDRAILSGTLFVDGFTKVVEAGNFLDALKGSRSAPLDLIIIEQQIGISDAKQFLERLRKHGECEDTPVVMIAENPGVRTTLMAKSSGIAHVQAKPADYDGELKGVLGRLLALT